MNSPNDEKDAEQMRLEFEAFMLQGKATSSATSGDASSANTTITISSNSKKKKKKKRPSTGPSPQKTPTTTPTKDLPSPNKKTDQSTKKKYYQLLHSFSNKIQQSWFELDNQILAILTSIVGIRERLPLEWKLLTYKIYDNTARCKDEEVEVEDWKQHGFRGKNENRPLHLHRDDVQLALENDMEQHENMISALRSLVTELSECHESLGRVVDTIWTFHLDCQQNIDIMLGDQNEQELDALVQKATALFQVLSTELYRKQCLIPSVIETINDEVLGEESNMTGKGDTPVEVARVCAKYWTRQINQNLITWVKTLGKQ